MNFESGKLEEENQKTSSVEQTPEAIEKFVTEIMSFENTDEVEKMAIAEKITQTFTSQDRQKLFDRMDEEIKKSKILQGKKAA